MPHSEIRRVFHETHYTYQDGAECAQQIGILQPQEGPGTAQGALRKGQRLLHSSLKIDPKPSLIQTHTDYLGNVITHFEINHAHNHLRVTSHSELEVFGPDLHPESIQDIDCPSWNKLVAQLTHQPGQASEWAGQFRFASHHVSLSTQMAQYAQLDLQPNRPALHAAFALMNRIYSEFQYVSGSTTIQTTVQEVMDSREGVCQDFAHLMISALRSMGLSALYVSGYLLTDPPEGQPKLMGADASHAWVSVWCGTELGWVDFDPTNNQLPDTRYVTTAIGRDYADVPPLRGVVHGGQDHTLKVAVTVF